MFWGFSTYFYLVDTFFQIYLNGTAHTLSLFMRKKAISFNHFFSLFLQNLKNTFWWINAILETTI